MVNSPAPISVRLHPLENYAFGLKDAQIDQDTSIPARIQRLTDEFRTDGMRITVEAVILCQQHGHPHILLFQQDNQFFKLPGDQLNPKEDPVKGMKRILDARLAPPGYEGRIDWQIVDLLSVWTRPNFDTVMYPYPPAHIKMPKEQKHMYLVTMPEKCVLACPKNFKLIAVPLFELYENTTRYGPIISSLPHLLARFIFQTTGLD